MNDDEPADDLRKLIEKNARPWNSFWSWRDKPIGEHGQASEILKAAGLKVEGLVSRPEGQDPPDCEGLLDGQRSGVEVTELVHRPTLERSLKAIKEREAGREPKKARSLFRVGSRCTSVCPSRPHRQEGCGQAQGRPI